MYTIAQNQMVRVTNHMECESDEVAPACLGQLTTRIEMQSKLFGVGRCHSVIPCLCSKLQIILTI
jgi:hypothetical protein